MCVLQVLADEIVVEEYFGQKIDDIKRFNVDIFTVGSDWEGYDYLNEYCKSSLLTKNTRYFKYAELEILRILDLVSLVMKLY